jgi:multiple sugar transport system substrate-binding protein
MFRRFLPALLLLAATILSACGGAAPAPAAEPTAAPAPAAEPTAAPAAQPTAAPAAEATAAPASQPTAAPAADTLSGTVNYWTAYNTVSPEFKVLTEQIIPEFQKLHPNVTINAQAIPYDELRKKLLAAIAGGETPDLLRADIIWVPEFAEQGALAKIDDLLPDFASLKDTFYPGPLATNFYQGHYYGLPLDTNTRVIFYNPEIFKAAGIADAPKTFEDFQADCAKIKALNKPDTFCYAEGGTGAWNVLPWIWSAGGSITDSNFTKATGYLNSKGTVEAVTMLRDMLKNGTLSPSILGGGLQTSEAIGKNQVGMIVDGPWMPPIFKEQFPDLKFGLVPMPSGSSGSSSVVGGEDIVIFDKSQNKDAAAAFMRFVLEEPQQIAMGKTGQMPVLKSLTGNKDLPDYFAVFQKQLETANPRTPSPAWPKIDDAINTAVQQVLRGEKEPQAALDEAAALVDGLLAGKK